MNKLGIFIAVSFWGNIAFPQQPVADVEDMKIALVYNFSKHINWQAAVLAAAEDVMFCVAGTPALIAKFAVLNSQHTSDKPIRVVPLQQSWQRLPACHLLHVAAAYSIDTNVLLGSFGSKPLPTVGDSRGFSVRGGMVELIEVHRRITFRINNAQVQANDIAISSMLLRLGR